MKTKRILSLLLSFMMLLSLIVTPAFAEGIEETVTVFINATQYGGILKDKNNDNMVFSPVELNGKDVYTLEDVFTTLHDTYYEGGSEEGYSSVSGEWGLYITKFWGDESGNFGYQVNGGTEYVSGLSHEIKDGDFIDVTIYKNTYPDTESYSKFNSFRKTVYPDIPFNLNLSQAGYDENWNTVFSPCEDAIITVNGVPHDMTTDSDGNVTLTFESTGEYIISAVKNKTVNEEQVPAITAPLCVVTVKESPDATITVPDDSTLFLGIKGEKHFVNFTEIEPVFNLSDGVNTTYYFELDNEETYNYRVSGDNYITYGGTFEKTENFNLTITKEQLMPEGKEKSTIDKDTSLNNGYNVADIYLNINPEGHLRLFPDDTFQIVALRNWEAVNNTTSNYFIEPDFHYEAIDENGQASDIVEIDKNGLLTAKKNGTAIVLVTYDSMILNFGESDFYGALWPENTGVFVVTVENEQSTFKSPVTINEGKNSSQLKLSGDSIDSEHDCIYFTGDEAVYTFVTGENIKVSVANPVIDIKTSYNGFKEILRSDDGSFSIPLLTGRNIVKFEKNGKYAYQVITAKKVNAIVNSGEPVYPGNTLKIEFDKLYHPANKLAGVYNMSASAVYTDVSGYEGKVIGATSAQYDFANNNASLTVSSILKEKDMWGCISYEKESELVIPEDYAYDTFYLRGGAIYVSGWGDSYGNHRAITYENGKGINLNADAKLAYLGKLPDMEIPITATNAELVSITLDTENANKKYFAGDKFDTKGLIVTAIYADESTQIATNYTVSPEILSTDTKKVTVNYRGLSTEIPVTVKEKSSGGNGSGSNNKISVYFTLLGDKKHGEPSDSSDTHTKRKGNLETWIPKTKITLDKESYVIDAVKKALSLNDIPYKIQSNYINEIKGLSEFDNGKLSGWMYTLNGKYPSLGINEQKLSSSDNIVLHYTDDYTAEKTNYSSSNSSSGKKPAKTEVEKEEETKPLKSEFSEKTYSDVTPRDWHYESVKYVHENGLMKGTENGFEPEGKMTRAMLITVLWRMAKEPSSGYLLPFEDVKTGQWYTDAIKWAASENIISGIGNNKFGTDDEVTREQMLTILYRYMQKKETVEINNTALLSYQDTESISEYALPAFQWAVNSKIINGKTENLLCPTDSSNRAEAATMLMRFCERNSK